MRTWTPAWMMSSETSTDTQPFEPWQFFTLAGLIGATIVVFFAKGQTAAAIILLSLTVFSAAAVGFALFITGRRRPWLFLCSRIF